MTAAERVARNTRIAEARAAGKPWAAIAGREGLSIKQCRRARDEYLDSAPPPPLDVAGSAMVGAARSLSSVGLNLVSLLSRLGRVGDPGFLRYEAEIRRGVGAVYVLAEQHDIPAGEVVAAMDRAPLRGMGLDGAA